MIENLVAVFMMILSIVVLIGCGILFISFMINMYFAVLEFFND